MKTPYLKGLQGPAFNRAPDSSRAGYSQLRPNSVNWTNDKVTTHEGRFEDGLQYLHLTLCLHMKLGIGCMLTVLKEICSPPGFLFWWRCGIEVDRAGSSVESTLVSKLSQRFSFVLRTLSSHSRTLLLSCASHRAWALDTCSCPAVAQQCSVWVTLHIGPHGLTNSRRNGGRWL